MASVSAMPERQRPRHVVDLRVSIIGAGLMGHSIAGVFAAAGAKVTVHDVVDEALDAVPERVAAQLRTLDRDPAPAAAIMLNRELAPAVADADLVIEAVSEDLALKQKLFAEVSRENRHAVLATNTSVLRIGAVAQDAVAPDRVLGTHWFNPPHLVPLVEVVQAECTSEETVSSTIGVLQEAGKLAVHVRRDIPGFIGNRIQHAMWREALSLVDAGVCDAETVDLVVRNSFGLRLAAMGPVENADYVGLDLVRAVHAYLFPSLSADRQPSARMRELVDAGHLGAKSGHGFLNWDDGQRERAAQRLEAHLLAQQRATPRDDMAGT